MKIAFSGVQCTGKTTIINELRNIKEFDKYLFCVEGIRSLQKQGFQINENGNNETQVAVMILHLMNLDKGENLILDRCLLDGMSYAEWSYNKGKINEETYKLCKRLFYKHIDDLDVIFYLVPEFEMVEDGTRSVNKIYRDEVKKIFDKYVDEIKSEFHKVNVIPLSGTVIERVNQVKNIVNVTDFFRTR